MQCVLRWEPTPSVAGIPLFRSPAHFCEGLLGSDHYVTDNFRETVEEESPFFVIRTKGFATAIVVDSPRVTGAGLRSSPDFRDGARRW